MKHINMNAVYEYKIKTLHMQDNVWKSLTSCNFHECLGGNDI